MAIKKPQQTSDQNKPVIKYKMKTSWECENQCLLPEMCAAGRNYVENMIPNRVSKGVTCREVK